jgi:hypothetical protein
LAAWLDVKQSPRCLVLQGCRQAGVEVPALHTLRAVLRHLGSVLPQANMRVPQVALAALLAEDQAGHGGQRKPAQQE